MIRSAIRQLLPPIVARFLPSPPKPNWFSGSYATWDDAAKQCTGYDDDVILKRVVEATRAVVRGDAAFERDTVLFNTIEYDWPLLSCLLLVAANCERLNVIDFGGALGSTYRQHQRFWEALKAPVSWNIVEQPALVEAGRNEFETDTLHFCPAIPDAAHDGVDVILFGCSLCYVPDPWHILNQAAQTAARYLILDRTPFCNRREGFFARQTVPPEIYDANYPIHVMSHMQLNEALQAEWTLTESWQSRFQPPLESVQWEGQFYTRRDHAA